MRTLQVGIRVTDLERSLAFYTGVPGRGAVVGTSAGALDAAAHWDEPRHVHFLAQGLYMAEASTRSHIDICHDLVVRVTSG